MSLKSNALSVIKARGPVPARQLALELNVDEKTSRSLIDRLRAEGEPVWHDPQRRAFWWRDDIAPGRTPHTRWKRKFE